MWLCGGGYHPWGTCAASLRPLLCSICEYLTLPLRPGWHGRRIGLCAGAKRCFTKCMHVLLTHVVRHWLPVLHAASL